MLIAAAGKVFQWKILSHFNYRRCYEPCQYFSLVLPQNGEARRKMSSRNLLSFLCPYLEGVMKKNGVGIFCKFLSDLLGLPKHCYLNIFFPLLCLHFKMFPIHHHSVFHFSLCLLFFFTFWLGVEAFI